jgi:hypothetical protein
MRRLQQLLHPFVVDCPAVLELSGLRIVLRARLRVTRRLASG